MKLQLPTVTLICADCVETGRAINALERCKRVADFGAVKFLTSLPTDYPHKVEIPALTSLVMYSVFMVKRIYEFVDTRHLLVVQRDGWIINVGAWNPAWLNCDYIAPLFLHYSPLVGSGGFSLRSRKLMELVSQSTPPWDGSEADTEVLQKQFGCYEDGLISIALRSALIAQGMSFATPEEGSKFAAGGNDDARFYVERPFGFHGANGHGATSFFKRENAWARANLDSGVVSPFAPYADFKGWEATLDVPFVPSPTFLTPE